MFNIVKNNLGLIFIITIIMVLIFIPSVFAKTSFPFNDDFESYEIGTTIVSGGTAYTRVSTYNGTGDANQVIISGEQKDGTTGNVLQLQGANSWSSQIKYSFTPDDKQFIIVEADVKPLSTNSPAGISFCSNNADGYWTHSVCGVSLANGGFKYGKNDNAYVIDTDLTYTVGNWYRLSLALDRTEHKFYILLDDELIGETSFDADSATPEWLELNSNNNGTNTAYFDNINLYSDDAFEIPEKTFKVKISTTDVAGGEEIEGATIQIIDNNEKIVEEWTSSKESYEASGLSSDIEYTLRNTVAPEGYTIATDTIFIIDDEGRITSSGTMTQNGVMLVEIAKTHVDILCTNDAIGATIQVLNSEGEIAEEWESTDEEHYIEGLNVDEEYTINVIIDSNSYEVCTFTIDENGDVDSDAVDSEGVIVVNLEIESANEIVLTLKDGKVLSGDEEDLIEFWVDYCANDSEGPGLLKLLPGSQENTYDIYNLEDKLLFTLTVNGGNTFSVELGEDVTSGDNIVYNITEEDISRVPGLASYKTAKLLFDVEEVVEKCKITFDSNGGSGTMNQVEVEKGASYTLPACSFKAPNNKTFDKWNLGKKGAKITVSEDTTLVAQWKDKSTNDSTSGGGSSSSSSSFKVSTKIENGTITPANANVKKNGSQEFTFKANEGYEIVDVIVDGKSVGAVDKYTLDKVKEKHVIEVKTQIISALINVDEWAKEEMAKAEELRLIPETFNKKDASKEISRADFCAVAVELYAAIVKNTVQVPENNPFTDTNDPYVLKAYSLGITKGISSTEFGNGTITREQMATMVDRALRKAGINITIDLENVTKFDDDNEMHDWGRPSIYAMAKEEIIKGVGNNKYNPLGVAKVEEAIAISLRCVEIYKK